MQNGEIIPMLIARIKQNNTDNMVIRSKLYSLLTDITNKFDEVIRAVPRIEDFQGRRPQRYQTYRHWGRSSRQWQTKRRIPRSRPPRRF